MLRCSHFPWWYVKIPWFTHWLPNLKDEGNRGGRPRWTLSFHAISFNAKEWCWVKFLWSFPSKPWPNPLSLRFLSEVPNAQTAATSVAPPPPSDLINIKWRLFLSLAAAAAAADDGASPQIGRGGGVHGCVAILPAGWRRRGSDFDGGGTCANFICEIFNGIFSYCTLSVSHYQLAG